MAIIQVKAIVVGDDNTTFYKADGSSFDLPTSDPRLKQILADAIPTISAGRVAELDFESVHTTHYREFEKNTGGLVKLFRVAKDLVKHIFTDPHDKPKPQTIGQVPQVDDPLHKVISGISVAEPTPKVAAAVDDILSRAQSVNDEKFTDDETKGDETIIAVVEDSKGTKTIIPGIENIKDHMGLALKLGSTIGVENFLRRISEVINRRGHSVEDLLRFMSRNDMPIADDGCLVAFKTLNRRGNHKDVYQDIHSGNVVQRVGSKVFMAESMVDPNRRNECSNGLHVARRAYVGGFRGSHGVMCLIKVAPEDVIAVPSYDANKMRVCGYHIVADVPSDDHGKVYSNQPIPKDSATAKLLGAVIKGQHIGVIEEVEIGGHRGTNLRIKKLGSEASAKNQLKEAENAAAVATPIASIDDKKDGANASGIDSKEVAKQVATAKADVTMSKTSQARTLFIAADYTKLGELKKAAKKSWAALGFNSTEETLIKRQLANPTPVAAPAPAPEKKEEPKMSGTRAEIARQLFDQAVAGDKSRWGSLWAHQKACKKSWSVLGFNPKEIERIKVNKPDHI